LPSPLAILLLIAVAASLYLPTLQNGFVFDDRPLLIGGEAGAEPFPWHSVFTRATHSFYRPFRSLSFRLDRHFWYLNPLGYHLGGLLLHSLVGIAFFILLLSLGIPSPTSLFAALLFLAHPANTEAVEYVSSRAELLGALFSLLFLLSCSRYLKHERRVDRSLALVFLAAALFSKETFLILSFFPLFLPGRGGKKKRLSLICFAIAGTFISARLLLLPGGTDIGRFGVLLGYPQILIKAPAVLFSYLRLLLFPIGLSPDHPLSVLPLPGPMEWMGQALFLAAALIVIAALGKLSRGSRLGSCCLLLSLLPLLNLYPAPRLFAEKYLYFPSLWFCLLLASLMNALCVLCGRGVSPRSPPARIAARRRSHTSIQASPCRPDPRPLTVFTLISASILVAFAVLTLSRHPAWRSELTLWASAAAKRPASPLVLFNRGVSLLEAGFPRQGIIYLMEADELLPGQTLIRERIGDAWSMMERPALARRAYSDALEKAPERGPLHLKLAAAYEKLGDRERAAESFELALSSAPSSPGLYRRLDLAGDYRRLIADYRNRGETDKARLLLRRALGVFPRDPIFLQEAGYDLLRQGKANEAAVYLERAREEAGDRADLLFLLGECRRGQGRLDEAAELYRESGAADPRSAAARLALGNILAGRGRDREAEAAFREALAIDPEDFQSWTNLGNIYQERGDSRKAEEAYLSSLAGRDNFKTRYNLGFLYLKRLGAPEKALPHLERARELCQDFHLEPRINAAIQAAQAAARSQK
jgi:tetratricopeptide (TPR) repeat protein